MFGAKYKRNWFTPFTYAAKIKLIPHHMPKKCFSLGSNHVTGVLHLGTKFSSGQLMHDTQLTAILRKLVSSHSDPPLTLVFTFTSKKFQPKHGVLFSCTIKPSELLNSSRVYDLNSELDKYSK